MKLSQKINNHKLLQISRRLRFVVVVQLRVVKDSSFPYYYRTNLPLWREGRKMN